MAGAEHVFIVQASSILALFASMIALLKIGLSIRKFSPSVVKTAVLYIFIQTILLSLSIAFMATYHLFDIDIATDMWHVGALLSLLMGVAVTFQIVQVCRRFK